ncbi:MAG: hypothetical protein HY812_05885 [Planctomycetes bacterium]|nr:hypothetical protein [Planctomycetota bacterium]
MVMVGAYARIQEPGAALLGLLGALLSFTAVQEPAREAGVGEAPLVGHRALPPVLFLAKCRTCHVQVRAVSAARDEAASQSPAAAGVGE